MALRETVPGGASPETGHRTILNNLSILSDSVRTVWGNYQPTNQAEALLKLVFTNTTSEAEHLGRLQYVIAHPSQKDVPLEFGYMVNPARTEDPTDDAYIPRLFVHDLQMFLSPLGPRNTPLPEDLTTVSSIKTHSLVDTYPDHIKVALQAPLILGALHFIGERHAEEGDMGYFFADTVTIADTPEIVFQYSAKALGIQYEQIRPLIPWDMICAPGIRQLKQLVQDKEKGRPSISVSDAGWTYAKQLLRDPIDFVHWRALLWPRLMKRLVVPGQVPIFEEKQGMQFMLNEMVNVMNRVRRNRETQPYD